MYKGEKAGAHKPGDKMLSKKNLVKMYERDLKAERYMVEYHQNLLAAILESMSELIPVDLRLEAEEKLKIVINQVNHKFGMDKPK